MNNLTMREQIVRLEAAGWKEMNNKNSGLGTIIMSDGQDVMRLGWDEAFDDFAKYVLKNAEQDIHLPCIYNHQSCTPPSLFAVDNSAYWMTKMELLYEVDSKERLKYEQWVTANIGQLSTGSPSVGFSGLENTVPGLFQHANVCSRAPDFTQGKNIMKRADGTLVVIDAFQ